MYRESIRFSTQTAGEQARRLLRAKGVSCTLRRNTKPNKNEGCSYVLDVNGDLQEALYLIESAGIPYLGTGSAREGQ